MNTKTYRMPQCCRTSSVRSLAAIAMMALLSLANLASGDDDLGQAATNPVANLMSFRAQTQISTYNNADGESVTGLFQSVLPFQTGWDSWPLFVTRITVPYTRTPDLPGVGNIDGFADTNMLNFFVPKKKILGATVGIGPALTIPTGGDNPFVGSNQWQIGPNVVYFNTNTPGLQWGMMVYPQFSFASTEPDIAEEPGSVSVLNVQPILAKHFDGGWYIQLPEVPQTYNFKTDQWILNLGGVVGRVFPWGKQPVQVYGGIYYNTEDYGDITPEWTFKFNISFLIPKK